MVIECLNNRSGPMKFALNLFNMIISISLVISIADAQWVRTGDIGYGKVLALAVRDSMIFAATERDGLFFSTDHGTTWQPRGLSGDVTALAINDTFLYAGDFNGNVYLSTDNGQNWAWLNNGLGNMITAITIIDSNIIVATYGGGMHRSTISGSGWIDINKGVPNPYGNALARLDSTLFSGTTLGNVYRSSDMGTNWSPADSGLTNAAILSLFVDGTNLFAGTSNYGIFRSTNLGVAWTDLVPSNFILVNSIITSFASAGAYLFAGSDGSGVFITADNGDNWKSVKSGLPSGAWIKCLVVSGNSLFCGVYNDGVWRRPLAEMITAVDNQKPPIPSQFVLEQNYPNPFNPTTVISFQLPVASKASLKVYDILGREVTTLVSGMLPAGNHSAQWNAGHLASGIYFCKLLVRQTAGGQAGSFTQTKKLILIK